MSESIYRTSPSLLARLRQDTQDQIAWSEFVRRYGPQIYTWCRAWKLQEADAQDVTQTVLLKLADKMRSFAYDETKSFRAYLKTLARYAWCDFLEAQGRPGSGTGDSRVVSVLQTVEAREDLLEKLHEAFDQELLEEAMRRVRERVEEHTWEAFRLTALDNLSGAEVADRLQMKVATVFKARSKVQQMLQDVVRALEEKEA